MRESPKTEEGQEEGAAVLLRRKTAFVQKTVCHSQIHPDTQSILIMISSLVRKGRTRRAASVQTRSATKSRRPPAASGSPARLRLRSKQAPPVVIHSAVQQRRNALCTTWLIRMEGARTRAASTTPTCRQRTRRGGSRRAGTAMNRPVKWRCERTKNGWRERVSVKRQNCADRRVSPGLSKPRDGSSRLAG